MVSLRLHSLARLTLLLSLCAGAGPVAAGQNRGMETAPTVLLQRTSQHMLSVLDQQRARIHAEPEYIYTVVEEVLVPHVDLAMASRWALGRHWREASAAQRARFQHEFHTLLVRFYATALAQYLDGHTIPRDVITFLPRRVPVTGKKALVRTLVRQDNGQPVSVNYLLRNTAQGWKVCDVRVEGVSIIGVYRSVFNDEVRRHGMDGLIQSMAKYNQRLSLSH